MIITLILWLIAGMCKGVTDSIAFHDSYAYKGYWWSINSWRAKKFLGFFVPNMWHLFDYLRAAVCMVSILFVPSIDWWLISIIPMYMLGFIITYK